MAKDPIFFSKQQEKMMNSCLIEILNFLSVFLLFLVNKRDQAFVRGNQMKKKIKYLIMLAFCFVCLLSVNISMALDGERMDIVPESMKIINERYHYSPAVKVGKLLFVAGQVGRDEEMNVVIGKEEQITQAFENLKLVLKEASADFDDVVEIVTYHTDMRDLELVVKIKDRYFKNRYPAWTGVGVSSLSTPGLEFEIKATAYLD